MAKATLGSIEIEIDEDGFERRIADRNGRGDVEV